jgi:UDP-2,3-diacylglucosamine hydrolase
MVSGSTCLSHLGLIAGRGQYPVLLAQAARARGLARLCVVGFPGETEPTLVDSAEAGAWLQVGQLTKMIQFFVKNGVTQAIMAGQVAPKHLFDLKPDLRALMLLAKLKERNAASIFRAIADELARAGVTLLPATTFMEDHLARPGLMAGPGLKKRQVEDVHYGYRIAKEMARLDIGQSVVVKNGTVLAVEAFEGTDACLQRGGPLGRGEAILVKVSKPQQDFRFDVPVIGSQTIRSALASGIRVIAVETGSTLLLEEAEMRQQANEGRLSLYGVGEATK